MEDISKGVGGRSRMALAHGAGHAGGPHSNVAPSRKLQRAKPQARVPVLESDPPCSPCPLDEVSSYRAQLSPVAQLPASCL